MSCSRAEHKMIKYLNPFQLIRQTMEKERNLQPTNEELIDTSDLTLIVLSNYTRFNVGGLLLSFDQRYWNSMKRYKYIEEHIKMLDVDGCLKQTRFTFVDEERARKRVEKDICFLYPELSSVDNLLLKYPCVGQHSDLKDLGINLTKYRDGLRDCYATSFFSDDGQQ